MDIVNLIVWVMFLAPAIAWIVFFVATIWVVSKL